MNQEKISAENLTPLVKTRIKNAITKARNLRSAEDDSAFLIALMKIRFGMINQLKNDYEELKRKAKFYVRLGIFSSLGAFVFWLIYVVMQIQNLVGTSSVSPLLIPLIIFLLLPLPLISGMLLASKQKNTFGRDKSEIIIDQATKVFDYTLVKGWLKEETPE